MTGYGIRDAEQAHTTTTHGEAAADVADVDLNTKMSTKYTKDTKIKPADTGR
jgi:hypothetical protein